MKGISDVAIILIIVAIIISMLIAIILINPSGTPLTLSFIGPSTNLVSVWGGG